MFDVRKIEWDSPEGEFARLIRIKVFVEEQKVPIEEEIDHIDPRSIHVLAYDSKGAPMGTGRLFRDPEDPHLAHIGRMAVLAPARGKGCGAAIMDMLIREAKTQGYHRIILSSQQYATGFYEKFGFHTVGDTYLDVDIPHIDMILNLEET